MAKALGRRPDETADEQGPRQRAETWALALIAGLMLLALVSLILFASQ